jgi:hypothetical protein
MHKKRSRKRADAPVMDATNVADMLAIRAGEIDRRTVAYRRFVGIRDAIYSDCGGKDRLSEVRLQLIDRFVTVCAWAETQDAIALSGGAVDLDLYARVIGHARRLAETIGLDREARDVTDLATYVRGKATEPHQDHTNADAGHHEASAMNERVSDGKSQ